MGVASDAVEGIYTILCRDPDTAAGGMDPSETTLHSEGFYREDRITLRDIEGSGIDRRVQILCEGTEGWGALNNGLGGKRQRQFGCTVSIGYFHGDNLWKSRMIAMDDEQKFGHLIGQRSNWPSDSAYGCVQGYMLRDSRFEQLDRDRYILHIYITVEVYGTR